MKNPNALLAISICLALFTTGYGRTDTEKEVPSATASAPATEASMGKTSPGTPATEAPTSKASPGAPAAAATAKTAPGAPASAPASPRKVSARPLSLPGSGPDGVMMDYLAYDPSTATVWVPAGNTGSVDVIQTSTGKLTRIEGFPTAEVERRGRKRTVGPSSATVGEGVVYIGNRADSSVCAVGATSLKRGACVKLESMPDGLAYIAPTKEIWVTTPRDNSITILSASDSSSLSVKSKITVEGGVEGYAVDEARGLFYTNLEEKDRTLAIDIRSHKITATWEPQCGEGGPRGLALDAKRGFLFVACQDHVKTLDAGHGGAILSKVDTGEGLDSIAYLAARHLLYAAAGQAAALTIAKVDDAGGVSLVATGQTAEGTRAVMVDAAGAAYVADSRGGRILIFPADSE